MSSYRGRPKTLACREMLVNPSPRHQSTAVWTRRRAKPAGALRPGDAIRLESGKRVVITYVSVGFAPTDRYIEWRGAPTRNWANVSLNAQVIMGWYAHFRDPSPFGRIFPNRWGRRGMRNRLAPAGCCWDERPSI